MEPKPPEHKIGLIMLFVGWGIFLGLLTYFFHIWQSNKENPNQTLQGLVLEDGSREVVLKANHQHHYLLKGKINQMDVVFFLDTGATRVVVPKDVASKLNLSYGPQRSAQTAGGEKIVYMTTIKEIQIGNIRLENVRAIINEHMSGNQVLLGMSALKRLNIQQIDNTMILRLPPNP